MQDAKKQGTAWTGCQAIAVLMQPPIYTHIDTYRQFRVDLICMFMDCATVKLKWKLTLVQSSCS